MKFLLYGTAVLFAIAVPATLVTRAHGQTPAAKASQPQQELVSTYCVGCHNTKLKTGGLVLEGLNLKVAENDAQIWEKVLRKLRGHQMPPPGSPQPMQKDVD